VLYGAEGEVVRGYYEADRQAGFPSRRIVKLTRKDGTQRDVEFSAFALGEKDIVIWVMHDITEGKLVEKALRASEEKFRIEE
jgi:PAS domain-containing protein